ncbi:MAG: hypothetical protein R3245_08120 [Kiloniellales bacterium]|nr:hypothetical protein [Kiloniellales bacterium]
MPRIRCHYLDCVFLDEGFCTAGTIELDPDEGCVTYKQSGADLDDDDFEGGEEDDWEDLGFGEDDDSWLDEAEFD